MKLDEILHLAMKSYECSFLYKYTHPVTPQKPPKCFEIALKVHGLEVLLR